MWIIFIFPWQFCLFFKFHDIARYSRFFRHVAACGHPVDVPDAKPFSVLYSNNTSWEVKLDISRENSSEFSNSTPKQNCLLLRYDWDDGIFAKKTMHINCKKYLDYSTFHIGWPWNLNINHSKKKYCAAACTKYSFADFEL